MFRSGTPSTSIDQRTARMMRVSRRNSRNQSWKLIRESTKIRELITKTQAQTFSWRSRTGVRPLQQPCSSLVTHSPEPQRWRTTASRRWRGTARRGGPGRADAGERGEEAGAGNGAARPCSPAPVLALRRRGLARSLGRRRSGGRRS